MRIVAALAALAFVVSVAGTAVACPYGASKPTSESTGT